MQLNWSGWCYRKPNRFLHWMTSQGLCSVNLEFSKGEGDTAFVNSFDQEKKIRFSLISSWDWHPEKYSWHKLILRFFFLAWLSHPTELATPVLEEKKRWCAKKRISQFEGNYHSGVLAPYRSARSPGRQMNRAFIRGTESESATVVRCPVDSYAHCIWEGGTSWGLSG